VGGSPEIMIRQLGSIATVAWNASSFASQWSVADPFNSLFLQTLRETTQYDIVEIASNDVHILDGAGHPLFQASTGIRGWTGSQVQAFIVEFTGVAVPQLMLIDGNTLRLVKYSGRTFTQAWSLSNYTYVADVGNTDADPEDEILCIDESDNGWSLVDSQTGAVQQHWPQFAGGNAFLAGFGDYWHDGGNEVVMGTVDGSLFGNSSTSITTGFH